MNEVMYKIKDALCGVLREFAQKELRQPQDVEVVKNALSGIQKIKILEEMERFRSGGFSSRMEGGSYDGGSYDDGGYNGGSYRRGGYSRRGSYRDGYSGHGLKEKMQRLAESASPEEREMLNRFMQQM